MNLAQGTPLGQRCRSLGTVCLVLGILEIVFCGQKVLLQLLSGPIRAATRGLMPSATHGPSPAMLAAAEALAHRTVPWEIARTVPFLVASVVLLFIARRLRAGDLDALGAARQWSLAALGVVALSVLIQIVAIVPATLEYQSKVVDLLPPASGTKGPFDVGPMMSSMTTIIVVMGLAMGALFMSSWPVVLYVWAGRVQRDARQPPAQ
jgi:hypothetical protein